MSLAPIVLFTYNRLLHTRQTIEALQKNELANKSELFIFSDGGKDEESWQKVNEVREYLKTIKRFKNIILVFREKNIGLADSIIFGVTDIVNRYGKIIVLEDDIVTSPYFLKFMNDALNFYEQDKKVWHISGWNYPITKDESNKTFLWRVMNCWGWATWQNRWRYFEKDANKLIGSFSDEDIYKFNLDGFDNFWAQVAANSNGKIDTWAIFWYATIFKNSGLCLNPVNQLIKNIGFDNEGTHTKQSSELVKHSLSDIKNYIFTKNIYEDGYYTLQIKKYLTALKGNTMQKRLSDKDYELVLGTPRFTEIEVGFIGKKIKMPDAASFRFLNYELFGLEIYKFLTDKEKPVIIDCGANIGMSVIYFKQLYPNAKIVAFEPDAKIFEYLNFNINSFGFSNVELIKKGLWSEETTLRFFSEGADGGRIALQDDEQNIIEIETIKLSEYLRNEAEVDFLKIDIEGAETEVLLECKEHLKNVQNIFIEYHSFADKNQTLSTILNILEQNGFRYYIEHIGVKSQQPFVKINNYVGFDNQLNIFGHRA